MKAPDPDDPERVLRSDNTWPIVVAAMAVLWILVLLTPFALTLVV